MDERKVTILETAATAVAEIAYFVENEGYPVAAKKFVDDAFNFFDKISNDIVEYNTCKYKRWASLGYQCAYFRKKYVVAFLSLKTEFIVCDFVSMKLLAE